MTPLFNQEIQLNPLKTREDFITSLFQLIAPVYQTMEEEEKLGAFELGKTGTVYSSKKQQIEGFLRTLWGLGPLFVHEKERQRFSKYKNLAEKGILAGTSPDSDFYWGELQDYDQLFVEMGALATYLIFTKESFYDLLTKEEQKNLRQCLNQINNHKIPATNWLFFRILVNTFLEISGEAHTSQLEDDLQKINSFYVEDGWYFDGYENQIDYYIPFAMAYYSLIFSQLGNDKFSFWQETFKKRSLLFEKGFSQWFVNNGASLPFGRSLTYRFAQSAFFSGEIFSHLPEDYLSLGERKYLLFQNMRHWFKQNIFTKEGFLTIGYYYPNLVMAEGYNGPGSPYWALKNYLILALPEDDPFWNVLEKVPHFEEKTFLKIPRMYLFHSEDGSECISYTMGQHSHEHAHGEAKYEKYAYSSTFGFSVPKGNILPKQGAFDSTLAVSLGDRYFQTVFSYEKYQLHENYLYGKWRPFPTTEIKTFIIPNFPWHLRLHHITTRLPLTYQEGGFSCPKESTLLTLNNQEIAAKSSVGTTFMKSFTKTPHELYFQEPEPNTSLYFPQTTLPVVSGCLPEGTHYLVTLVAGFKNASLKELQNFEIFLKDKNLNYTYQGVTHQIFLEEL